MEKRISYHERGQDSLFKIWHALEEHMLIYMYSDGGSIVCSEKSYPIKKGALCLIGAKKHHYTMPDEPKCYDRSKVSFSAERYQSLLMMLPSLAEDAMTYAQIPDCDQTEVDSLFRQINNYDKNKTYGDLIFLSCLAKLLYYLDRYAVESIPSTCGFLNQSIEYINNHIFSRLTVDKICDHCHISKYYYCRKFKETMGMTVMEYILKTRIVLAQTMLLKEELTITAISERCGFSGISYFCRVFKEETGVSPLQYRKNAILHP